MAMESLYPAAPGFCHCLAALKTTPVLVQKTVHFSLPYFSPFFRIFSNAVFIRFSKGKKYV